MSTAKVALSSPTGDSGTVTDTLPFLESKELDTGM